MWTWGVDNRTSRAALAWNPDVATQVMVASDDDTTPIVQMWDLRNAHSPARVLTGHSRGILDMSWCPFDSSMLLTCGKDNRTICWNPNSGQIMCDLPSGNNWNFDARWSPKLPAILATASFDGSVNVYSLTDTGSGTSGGAVQAPGWLKRPAGATFGFGGQLATFNKKLAPDGQPGMASVQLRRPGTDSELLQRADELNTAIQQGTLKEFCDKKIAENPGAEEWQFMSILFDEDTRRRLTHFVGFSREDIAAEVPDTSNRCATAVQPLCCQHKAPAPHLGSRVLACGRCAAAGVDVASGCTRDFFERVSRLF